MLEYGCPALLVSILTIVILYISSDASENSPKVNSSFAGYELCFIIITMILFFGSGMAGDDWMAAEESSRHLIAGGMSMLALLVFLHEFFKVHFNKTKINILELWKSFG